jgi:predicted ATPase
MLRSYFEQTSTGREEENKARFTARFEALLATTPDPLRHELDRVRSFLGALVELYWPDSLYIQLEPRLRFENTLDALATLLRAESMRQPSVVQLEDLQWLDADSKHLLQYLGRVIANDPVAIIATSRERPAPDWFPPGIPQTTLDLNVLPATTVGAYASAVLNAPVAPELVDLLVQRAECNPFFMEQLLRYLQEQNLLAQTTEGWLPISSGMLLPTDVRTVLVARLDRLTQDVKQVVQTAAVLGREFEVRVLSQMLQGDPALPGKLARGASCTRWRSMRWKRCMPTISRHTMASWRITPSIART